jgi:hypothetical protein
MAYTFAELAHLPSLTENDHSVLDYFRSWGCEPGCVYFAQAATILSHEARGAMAALAVCLPKHASREECQLSCVRFRYNREMTPHLLLQTGLGSEW